MALQKTCSQCGSPFTVHYHSDKRKTCSEECRWKSARAARPKSNSLAGSRQVEWVTVHCPCGAPLEMPPWKAQGQRNHYCSAEHRQQYMPKPVGRPNRVKHTKREHGSGYLWVYLTPEQRPPGWGYSHYPEHRQVMRQVLGRDLRPFENVHHINGDKADNRPENLELWVSKQPKGQRVEDLLAWAREVVALYG